MWLNYKKLKQMYNIHKKIIAEVLGGFSLKFKYVAIHNQIVGVAIAMVNFYTSSVIHYN